MSESNPALPVRTLLVDDSPEVRLRLRSLIEESSPLEVVAETGDRAEALKLARELLPDAVVWALGPANPEGNAILRAIKDACRSCMILVLSTYDEEGIRKSYFEAGAAHVLDKSREFEMVPRLLLALGTGSGMRGEEAGGTPH